MATKKKGKGTGAKKAGKASATKEGKAAPKKAAAPKAAGSKKRIFVTLQVSPEMKAKLQAAADKKAGKPGASLAGYCREILAATVAG